MRTVNSIIMPYYVIVSGLPKTVKKQKMVHFLRQFVFKKPPLKFWIESLDAAADMSNQMVVRLETEADADTAARSLQDYPFQHTDQQIYLLKCWMKSEAPVMPEGQDFAEDVTLERELRPVEMQRPYSPVTERDRSPHLRNELTKLQLEIELTNKKRMLIEAERNLILEQKRLEMLQEAGPSALEPNQAPAAKAQKKKERKRPQDQNKPGESSTKLYWPCKIIGKEIKKYVFKHIHQDQRPIFYGLMRNTLKKRLSDILQGEVNHNTKKIISQYRKLYPVYTDEKFVITLRDMIKQGQGSEEFRQQSDSSNVNMTNVVASNIDPADLPISELSKDLDDWTEDAETTSKTLLKCQA